MAQQDITGLLTGIFAGDEAAQTQKLLSQKAVAQNPNLLASAQTQIGRAPEQLARMRQNVGGMFGQDLRSSGEKVQEQLQGLDVTTPMGQRQAVELVSQIDRAKALALQLQFDDRNKAEQLAAETLEIEREKLKESSRKLTDADNKRIADAEEAAGTFGSASRSATAQALRFETEKPTGGFRGSAYEGFKNFFGTQDDISALKTAFTEVVNTNIINSLPPGVASDKDIAMAMSGFPNKDWSHTQIAQWLRGRAKLTAFAAEKEKLKSKYLNDKSGNLSGFTEMWDNLRESDGYKETVAQAYNLPGYAIPAKPVSFDQTVFDSLLEKNKSRQPSGRNAPRAKVEAL